MDTLKDKVERVLLATLYAIYFSIPRVGWPGVFMWLFICLPVFMAIFEYEELKKIKWNVRFERSLERKWIGGKGMRAKYIAPNSVFRSKNDMDDYWEHDRLVRSLFPALPQPVRIVVIARFCYGYDLRTICRRCRISQSTLRATINAFNTYDAQIHPVPLKEAM